MNKLYWIIGLAFIYTAVTLFVWVNSDNETKYTAFVSNVFAQISYDTQDPSKWYNANVPEAVVTTIPAPILPPIPPVPPVRHSH